MAGEKANEGHTSKVGDRASGMDGRHHPSYPMIALNGHITRVNQTSRTI